MVVVVQQPVFPVPENLVAAGTRRPLVEVAVVVRELVGVEGGPVAVAKLAATVEAMPTIQIGPDAVGAGAEPDRRGGREQGEPGSGEHEDALAPCGRACGRGQGCSGHDRGVLEMEEHGPAARASGEGVPAVPVQVQPVNRAIGLVSGTISTWSRDSFAKARQAATSASLSKVP